MDRNGSEGIGMDRKGSEGIGRDRKGSDEPSAAIKRHHRPSPRTSWSASGVSRFSAFACRFCSSSALRACMHPLGTARAQRWKAGPCNGGRWRVVLWRAAADEEGGCGRSTIAPGGVWVGRRSLASSAALRRSAACSVRFSLSLISSSPLATPSPPASDSDAPC